MQLYYFSYQATTSASVTWAIGTTFISSNVSSVIIVLYSGAVKVRFICVVASLLVTYDRISST